MAKLVAAGYQYVHGITDDPWDLVLRQLDDPEQGFQWKDQKHYDLLGAGVTDYLEERLRLDCHLDEVCIGSTELNAGAKVFVSPGLEQHTGPLLILVAGSAPGGHAGMWARSLCINESLLYGSMLPYVQRAQKDGWAVIVANPNVNKVGDDRIAGSETPHRHLHTVWAQLVDPCPASAVLIVAHSYGGCSTTYLLKTIPNACKRLAAIAFTDAGAFHDGSLMQETVPPEEHKLHHELKAFMHYAPEAFEPSSKEVEDIMATRALNFVVSEKPLGTPEASQDGCTCVSAGHKAHIWTSGMAIDEVFAFLQHGIDGTVERFLDQVWQFGIQPQEGE